MAAAAAAVAPQWPALQKLLEKKSSFEAAASQCVAALRSQPGQAASPELRTLLARCSALLRSRYSNPAFVSKGRELFRAAHDAAPDEALRAELRGYISQCGAMLGEDDAGPSEQQPTQPQQPQPQGGFLFEGTLGAAPAEPAAAPGSAGALAAALLDHMPLALAQQLLGQQHDGEQGQQGQQQAPSPEVLEALQQELDAIAVRLMEETGQHQPPPPAAPPASKKVVRALPREALTAARLQELGGPHVRCPVCMEDLEQGVEVQVMPCKHVFHPSCLAPWLEQHNSCPTCRLELKTDDERYERRKEQEKVLEEERRGAENALSHSEFLYI